MGQHRTLISTRLPHLGFPKKSKSQSRPRAAQCHLYPSCARARFEQLERALLARSRNRPTSSRQAEQSQLTTLSGHQESRLKTVRFQCHILLALAYLAKTLVFSGARTSTLIQGACEPPWLQVGLLFAYMQCKCPNHRSCLQNSCKRSFLPVWSQSSIHSKGWFHVAAASRPESC